MVLAGVAAGCTPVPSSVRPSTAPHSATAAPSPTTLTDTEPPVEPPEPPPPATLPLPPEPPAAATTASTAVACAGHPSANQVVALLRAKGILAGTAGVSVQVGPLCDGTWQYTVLTVPGREPLQVVTEGSPSALQLVAAGTDVCTGAVVGQAPPGILTVARCTG